MDEIVITRCEVGGQVRRVTLIQLHYRISCQDGTDISLHLEAIIIINLVS